MRRDPKLAMLRSIDVFEGLSTRELREVSRMCTEVDVSVGRTMTIRHGTGLQCFIVVEGSVDVVADDRVVATLGSGDVLGEMSLLNGARRAATAVATSPVHALVMSPHEFFSVTGRFPTVAHRLASTANSRLSALAT